MKYGLYISKPSSDFYIKDILSLLEHARENNQKKDISGLLIYKPSYFMQYVEGPDNEVDMLLQKIHADDRHSCFVLLDEGAIEKRLFPDWTMGFSHMSWVDKLGKDGINKDFTPDQWPTDDVDRDNAAARILINFSNYQDKT